MHSTKPEGLRVLLVDDEPNIRKTMIICLEDSGHEVIAAANARDALVEASRRVFDMAFVDLRLGNDSGLDLIPELLAANPGLKIVVITAYASFETAVEAIKRGARDYLPKPFTPAQIGLAVRKISELRALEQQLFTVEEALGQSNPGAELASHAPSMQRALALARQVASSAATLSLTGETGTGKGVLARAIHQWSPRNVHPFAVVPCPSLSAELLESELFGHVKGAFTGAVRDNAGRIAACEGGTLFLDEVGDLPLALQAKFLRFIQERDYERVGDSVTRVADVRIIAATNRDLKAAVCEGKFREDLYYRLNVIQIDIPPLRERVEDIEPLSRHLLAFFARQNHRRALNIPPSALAVLKAHDWPGNVRELRNMLERAAILCQGDTVGAEYFPILRKHGPSLSTGAVSIGSPVSLEKIEEEHIRRILASALSLEAAATLLDIDQATLWRKRKRYGI